MATRREFLAASAGAIAGGLLLRPQLWAQEAVTTNAMAAAATRMLAGVTSDQRTAMKFPVTHAERYEWHFVPLNDTVKKVSTRKGVCLDDMPAESRAAAMDLLKTATSADGFKWCKDIMDRENILAELEPNNVWYRKPGWYFYTVYGEPAATGDWGWRIDGHHISISASISNGKLVSSTPYFLGVNPVTLKHGPRSGERETITPCEDLGRELFLSLDAEQQKAAKLANHLPDVPGKTLTAPKLATGISLGKLNNKQQELALAVIAHFTGRMPAEFAKSETDKLIASGMENLSFGYSGEAVAGKQHTYNLQGPTFQVHYMNVMTDPQRNPANHIHSAYRSLSQDFGGTKPVG